MGGSRHAKAATVAFARPKGRVVLLLAEAVFSRATQACFRRPSPPLNALRTTETDSALVLWTLG